VHTLALIASLAAGGQADSCAAPASRTLASSAQVRVYASRRRVFGCVKRTGRRVELRPSDPGELWRPARAAAGGRFATVAWTASSRPDGVALVETFDVADADAQPRVASWGLTIVDVEVRPAYVPRVPALLTTPRGSAAYVIDGSRRGVWEVHRLVPGEHDELDEGPGVARASLRRVGSRVQWTRGGRRYAAALP
jgi:hypothetical protein